MPPPRNDPAMARNFESLSVTTMAPAIPTT